MLNSNQTHPPTPECYDFQNYTRLYSKYEVPEYWLIDRNQKSVEIYRLREKELRPAEILTGTDELTTPVLPQFSCLSNQIFILPPLSNQ